VFPHLAGLAVERVFVAGRPCGRMSGRVHSRYKRLSETAVAGQDVMTWLRVRLFFLPQPGLWQRRRSPSRSRV
jgi:hypothetical protein